jgi:CRISPR type I-E-associated protein CasB/Cse2
MDHEITAFLSKLRTLKTNRGALAMLRRGNIDGISVLADVLPRDWKQKWFLLVAECWADNTTDGDKLALVCKNLKINENRFRILLFSDREELPQRMKSILRMISQKGFGVNWFLLLRDLIFWGENVQREWAMDFWATKTGEEKHE